MGPLTPRSAGDDDVLTIGLNRAVTLLAEAKSKRRGSSGTALGEHPKDGKPVTLHSGRYGPYVKHGRTIASVPRDRTAEEVTLANAVELLAQQAGKAKGGRRGRAKAKGSSSSSGASVADEDTPPRRRRAGSGR